MWLVNQPLNFLFDLAMLPFAGESPWPGLIAASLLTAAVLVGLFCVTSNQRAILRSRNQFLARTLELLLFQHDLRVSLTACGRILKANFVYLFQFLLPMIVGLIPLVLIFVQMEAWFDRRPLAVGEAAVLTIQLDAAHPVIGTPVELTLPDTARIDSPVVRTPTKNEAAWRFVATKLGSEGVVVNVNGHAERKSLIVGSQVVRVSPRRESSGVADELFAPSESPLAKSSPVRRMEISYPHREVAIGLTEIPWIVAAVVLMMAFSLILGSLFGVRIA
jgi:hypothetical protein